MRSPLVPPILATLVREGLIILDGVVFDSREQCPFCGGSLSGYDTRVKQVAVLRSDEGERVLHVTVKRFSCRSCGRVCNADEPFYPDTRIGSPVIDLCIAFSGTMGYGRAARYLSAMGIAVDRMSCRHYAQTPAANVIPLEFFGFPIPRSVVTLSSLATGQPEGSVLSGTEALAACNFPSSFRVPEQAQDTQ